MLQIEISVNYAHAHRAPDTIFPGAKVLPSQRMSLLSVASPIDKIGRQQDCPFNWICVLHCAAKSRRCFSDSFDGTMTQSFLYIAVQDNPPAQC